MLKRPFFSFRVVTLAQSSPTLEMRFDHQALVLVNECAGWSEVGSLFLRPERRMGGAGRRRRWGERPREPFVVKSPSNRALNAPSLADQPAHSISDDAPFGVR